MIIEPDYNSHYQ